MAIPKRRLTLEQFLELPEEEPALEYIDGEVTRKVSPQGKHSGVQTELIERFNGFGRPRKLARAFSELRVTFGGRSLVPDVVVYLWERIPIDEHGELADRFVTPPDIAVEIVSPDQSVPLLTRRCRWYVANGVRIALLIDPARRTIVVFRPASQSTPLRGADVVDLGDVLPGFSFTVSELFDSLKMR